MAKYIQPPPPKLPTPTAYINSDKAHARSASTKLLPVRNYDIPIMIALCGRFGVGKTYIGNMLTAYGYQKYSFGNCVREAIIVNTNSELAIKGIISTCAQLNISLPHPIYAILYQLSEMHENLRRELIYRKPTQVEIRHLLQWYGTEYGRAIRDDIWVEALRSKLAIEHPRLAVIDDWRFQSETRLWEKLRVAPLRIRITSTDPVEVSEHTNHISETTINSLLVDVEMDNSRNNRITPQVLDLQIIRCRELARAAKRNISTTILPLYRPLLGTSDTLFKKPRKEPKLPKSQERRDPSEPLDAFYPI